MAALLPTTLWGKGEVTYTRLQSFSQLFIFNIISTC